MSNKLWQCPLKVERGTNEEMPKDWLGAAVSFYVGAENHEEALIKAVKVLNHMGMNFIDLIGGKVIQLDPEKWWNDYVMVNYPEYSAHFPSQEEARNIVKEGLVFHGPFAGWDQGPTNA